MKRTFYVYLLFFEIFSGGLAFAQTKEVTFSIIAGASGISLGKVNSVTQDKYGFMWFSDQTNRCIVRYDGTTMKRYIYDFELEDTPGGMGGYYPEWLHADQRGFIWIGYYGQGLDRFDPGTGTFVHYKHQANDSTSLINNTVSCVMVDHLDQVWVGTDGGLDMLDQQTGKFTHFTHDPNNPHSLSYDMVRSIYEDRQGTIWVGTGFEFNLTEEGGLNRLDRETGTFTRYLNEPGNPHSLADNKPRALFEDTQGNFWVGTGTVDGLQIMDRERGTFTRFEYDPRHPKLLSRPPLGYANDHVTFISEDSEGQIWIGTEAAGMVRYDPATKKMKHYGGERNISGEFVDNSGWCINVSPDGLVWISTQGPHLYRIDLDNVYIPNEQDYLLSIGKENEAWWWFSSIDGLERRNLSTGASRLYNDQGLIFANRIMKDHTGAMWFAAEGGLKRYNTDTDNFTTFLQKDRGEGNYNSMNTIKDLAEDRKGRIWLATNYGVVMFDHKSGYFTHFRPDRNQPGAANSFWINTVTLDSQGNVWIGADDGRGIARFDSLSSKFINYLSSLVIYDMLVDGTGLLWVGTSNGLYYYDRIKNNFISSPLVRVPVYGIAEDTQRNLWLATYQAFIYKIDKDRQQAAILNQKNGLGTITSGGFYYGGAYVGPSGKIYMLTPNGRTYKFSPEKLSINADSIRLYFTGFWIGETPIQSLNLGQTNNTSADTEEIKLAYDENTFSFTASKVDLRATSNTSITYRMENYDVDWLVAQPDARIVYYNMPAGKYRLIIRSANSTGQVAERMMGIIVAPPWWQTWWAYASYGLLFVGGVFATDRYQRKRLLAKASAEAKEKELEQAREIEKAYKELKATQSQLIQSEKMASLGELTAGIAHEIQNPLNFVNNFSEVNTELIEEAEEEIKKGNALNIETILRDIKENEIKIVHHGKRADAIVKGMLQHSRASTGIKELTDINVLGDEYLRLAYHGLRAKDKSFNARHHTALDPALPKISVVPQDIGRVVLNLINNAFYAVSEKSKQQQSHYQPTVTVSTKKAGVMVMISIRDNGNGIPESAKEKIFQPFFSTKPTGQGTGLGLSLSYDIVKAHGGELKVETKEGEGSDFIILLPVV